MATDFRFNAQNSYSPLLSALAEAPYKREQMRIMQEQNQRQRLSDLLTNIASAATLSRQFQVKGAIDRLSKQAGGEGSVGGNAAMINPEGFATVSGQLPATMMGLNAAFPAMQPQGQAPSQEGVQSQTPGSVKISPDEGVLSPDMIRNKFILKTLMGEPKQVVEPNTGTPYDSYGPGMNFKTFQGGESSGVVLPPKKMEAANAARDSFQKREDIQKAVSDIPLLDQLEAAVKENNPAAIQNIKAQRMESGGIPGGRASSAALAGEFGSRAYGSQIGRWWEQAWTGKLPPKDQKQFLDQIKLQRNMSLKNVINSHADVAAALAKDYGIDRKIAHRKIGEGIEAIESRYDPKFRPNILKSVEDVKIGEVYNGHRYKGGDKADKNSWVKTK